MDISRKLGQTLEDWIPDNTVFKDLHSTFKSFESSVIEFESGTVHIPDNCKLDIVSKAALEQRYDIGFGSCLRTIVAVGGVDRIEHGVLKPKICFAVLWYSDTGHLITVDFSESAT
jgi:hypothetical protein